MKTEYDYRIILTDEQQATLEKAIELLEPFDKEHPSYDIYYFVDKDENDNEKGDLDLIEYDCCGSVECMEKTLAELRAQYHDHIIDYYNTDSNTDHENIESCYCCERPLNASLTWIKYEFDHHKEHSTNYASITESRNAFDIRTMLESFPSNDHNVGGYAVHQASLGNPEPLQKALKYQEDFVNEVIEFANDIIKTLYLQSNKKSGTAT